MNVMNGLNLHNLGRRIDAMRHMMQTTVKVLKEAEAEIERTNPDDRRLHELRSMFGTISHSLEKISDSEETGFVSLANCEGRISGMIKLLEEQYGE